MSDTLHATVTQSASEEPDVRVVYGVELSPDARTVVSSKVLMIEHTYVDEATERRIHIAWTPEDAWEVAHTIITVLKGIELGAVADLSRVDLIR